MRMPAAFLGALLPLLSGCDPGAPASIQAAASPRGFVIVNEAAKELRLNATFHRGNAEQGTWHLLVEDTGSMAGKAIFTTDVNPAKFYASLKSLGAADANNVTPENLGEASIETRGDLLDYLVEWKGVKEPMPITTFLAEVVPDLPSSGGRRGIEMRFGGNYTNEDASSPPCCKSGCLACLYTCSAGVTSNARANLSLLRAEKDKHRYRLNPKVELSDGAKVRLIVRIRERVASGR